MVDEGVVDYRMTWRLCKYVTYQFSCIIGSANCIIIYKYINAVIFSSEPLSISINVSTFIIIMLSFNHPAQAHARTAARTRSSPSEDRQTHRISHRQTHRKTHRNSHRQTHLDRHTDTQISSQCPRRIIYFKHYIFLNKNKHNLSVPAPHFLRQQHHTILLYFIIVCNYITYFV